MAIKQLRTSWSMECDTPGCSQDVIGTDEQDCKDSGALAGWRMGKQCVGPHACPECAAGRVPVAAASQAVAQQGGMAVVAGLGGVKVGDPMYADDGTLAGHAKIDGNMGEQVPIEPTKELLESVTGLELRDNEPARVEVTNLFGPPTPAAEPVEEETGNPIYADMQAIDFEKVEGRPVEPVPEAVIDPGVEALRKSMQIIDGGADGDPFGSSWDPDA